MDYVEAIEDAVGKRAIKRFLPLQPGDVPDTYCNSDLLEASLGFRPSTPIRNGVKHFVDWYRNYYGV